MLKLADAGAAEQAAAAGCRALDRKLLAALNKETGKVVVPMMLAAVSARANTPLRRAVAQGGRYTAAKGIPGVRYGGVFRPVVRGAEFGAKGVAFRTYSMHSPRGRTYFAERRTTRQFGTPNVTEGHFITPAAEAIAPAVIDVWETLVWDALAAAVGGGVV